MANKHVDGPAAAGFPLHVLREYALLADGDRGILVGPRGGIAWMCAPHWDSDAVFFSLIGDGGMYGVTPTERPFVWGGYYEQGSLIWHGRWVTTSRIIECRDALAFPGDAHTTIELRRILALGLEEEVRVVRDVRAGFGRHRMSRLSREANTWTARCGPLYLRWSGAGSALTRHDGALEAIIAVPKEATITLSWNL